MPRKQVRLSELPEFGIHESNMTLIRWERDGAFPRRVYDEKRKPCYDAGAISEWLARRAQAQTAAAETNEAHARKAQLAPAHEPAP